MNPTTLHTSIMSRIAVLGLSSGIFLVLAVLIGVALLAPALGRCRRGGWLPCGLSPGGDFARPGLWRDPDSAAARMWARERSRLRPGTAPPNRPAAIRAWRDPGAAKMSRSRKCSGELKACPKIVGLDGTACGFIRLLPAGTPARRGCGPGRAPRIPGDRTAGAGRHVGQAGRGTRGGAGCQDPARSRDRPAATVRTRTIRRGSVCRSSRTSSMRPNRACRSGCGSRSGSRRTNAHK